MSGFADRLTAAKNWEWVVRQALEARGWHTEEFGQAMLSDDARAALRDRRDEYGQPTLLRWLPDIIAYNGLRVCLVDAKGDRGGTPNFAIEVSAVDTGIVITEQMHTPLYYVWQPEGWTLTPAQIQNRHAEIDKRDGSDANGSGTAFYLIRKKFADHPDLVFGPVLSPPEPQP
jgi:hypothetical protein